MVTAAEKVQDAGIVWRVAATGACGSRHSVSCVSTIAFGGIGHGAFGGKAVGDLYLRFALTLLNESGAGTFHAQAYIPT